MLRVRWCMKGLWLTLQYKPAAVYADDGCVYVRKPHLMLKVPARSHCGRHFGKALFLFGPVVVMVGEADVLKMF